MVHAKRVKMDRYFEGKVMRHCPCDTEEEACQYFWNGTDTLGRYYNPWSSYHKQLRENGPTWRKIAARCGKYRRAAPAEEEEEEPYVPPPPPSSSPHRPSSTQRRAYDSAFTKLLDDMDAAADAIHGDTRAGPSHNKNWRESLDARLTGLLQDVPARHMSMLMEKYREPYLDRLDRIEHEIELHDERAPLAELRDKFENLMDAFQRAKSVEDFADRLRRTEVESERVLRAVKVPPESQDTVDVIMGQMNEWRDRARRAVKELREHHAKIRKEKETKKQELAKRRKQKALLDRISKEGAKKWREFEEEESRKYRK
jgi:hypothetical protein